MSTGTPDLNRRSNDRRQTSNRSGSERRQVNVAPPPGAPVRSGEDRRALDRRTGVDRRSLGIGQA